MSYDIVVSNFANPFDVSLEYSRCLPFDVAKHGLSRVERRSVARIKLCQGSINQREHRKIHEQKLSFNYRSGVNL